jgi:hypothetical protein
MRDGESGIEAIEDTGARSALRRTARRIQLAAPLAALVLTGLALWLARLAGYGAE